MAPLNYRHLYYFWVVAKEGGMARAAERLDVAVQTVSAQVRELEQSLGHALFKPAGRGITLTEAGQAAMVHADQIFQLGEQLVASVREAATGQGQRLAVGISDGLPKLVVRHLLQPALQDPRVRQAFTHAIDRQAIVDSLWAGRPRALRGWRIERAHLAGGEQRHRGDEDRRLPSPRH